MSTHRTRIERLERGAAKPAGRCPTCPAMIGFVFDTPPAPEELAALPRTRRPHPAACPRCGTAALKVYEPRDLKHWAELWAGV